jgi:hypothetical protein
MERRKSGTGDFQNKPHIMKMVIADIIHLNYPVYRAGYGVGIGF